MNDFIRWVSWGTSCLALLALAGCGSSYDLAPVRGQVTCQDKPVPGGRITFTPIAEANSGDMPAPAAMGTVDEEGNFELYTNGQKGAMVGRHRVSFTFPSAADAGEMEEEIEELSAELEQGNVDDADEMKTEIEEMKAEMDSARRLADMPCRAPEATEVSVNPGDNVIEVELGLDDYD